MMNRLFDGYVWKARVLVSALGLAAGLVVPVVTASAVPAVGVAACALLTIIVPPVEWRLVKPQVRHCAERYAEHAWECLEHIQPITAADA